MKRPGLVESVLLIVPVRLFLGGLFALAAFKKLQDPQSFAEAIKGFKVVDPATHGHLIVTGAFTMPWVEMVAAVLLILGLWTRAAGVTVVLALGGFIAALISVIARGLDANCSCFGDLSLFCGSEVGWCQVARNLILILPALYLAVRGGGRASMDAATGCCRAAGRCPVDQGGAAA